MPHIVSTATEFPSHYYTQEELIGALREIWKERHFNLERLEQFHRNVLVGGRHLALPMEEYEKLDGFQSSNDAWIEVAQELGERTVTSLLQKARTEPGAIDQFVFTTVTGLAVPSMEARLMNRLAFPNRMKRLPLFGLGCMAGAAGVARLHDYLVGHPREAGILLSIELCSLTLQRKDLSVANIISSGLFGDGAAAVLMVGDEHPLAKSGQPRSRAVRSIFFPDSERVMGWDMVDTGFKVVLSADIAPFTKSNLRPGIEEFLKEHDLNISDIRHWIAHPGGPKIIEAMTESLDLPQDALQLSLDSLAKVGNLSSASVLFVLQSTLEQKTPAPGDYGMLTAMGPAFSAEAVLLQW